MSSARGAESGGNPFSPLPQPTVATLAELAALVGGRVEGDGQTRIAGLATLHEAEPGQLTWAVRANHLRRLAGSRASAVVCSNTTGVSIPALVVADVEAAVAALLARFAPPVWRESPGVHPTAQVDATARLEAGVAIGPYVVIGPGTTIGARSRISAGSYIGAGAALGADCDLWPNVFVGDRCTLGARVRIWPNAVIGRDGFGFIFRQGRHQRLPQIGAVVIEDDVEIGACVCVDRAKTGVTRVGTGSKIDNLVQFAHNSAAGPGCILVAQVGISGSVRLGRGVVLGGQAGVVDNVDVGDGVRCSAQTAVTRSLPAGFSAAGNFGRERMQVLREQAALQRLPALLKEVEDLSRRIRELEAAADHRGTG